MERRVGDALADLGGELLDVAFTLGEDVDELGPSPVAERLGDLGEPVEQCVLLGRSPTATSLLKEPLDKLVSPWRLFKRLFEEA